MGERRRAPRRALRGGDIFVELAGASLPDPHLHHLDRPRDAGQQIVEVVCETAGQLADRFHLLRLAQMLLGDHQIAGALLDLLFQRGVERRKFLFDAAPLGRVAGALGDLAHERDLVFGP